MWMSDSGLRLSGDEMMNQAKWTVHDYLISAIENIDKELGPGSAKKHPELIGAYIQSCALDYGATLISQQIRLGLNYIAEMMPAGSDA